MGLCQLLRGLPRTRSAPVGDLLPVSVENIHGVQWRTVYFQAFCRGMYTFSIGTWLTVGVQKRMSPTQDKLLINIKTSLQS